MVDESLFQAVLEGAPDAYLILAPDAPRFTIRAASDVYLRATMTRRADIVGRGVFEVFPENPQDPQAAAGRKDLLASLQHVLDTHTTHRMPVVQYDLRRPDGSFEERHWASSNCPVFDSHGRVSVIVHRTEDVTGRVLASRRLRALESALTQASEAVVITEPAAAGAGLRIVDVNDGYTVLTGFSREELVGKPASWLASADTPKESATRLRAALEHGESVRVDLVERRKDGTPIWVDASLAPVRDETGGVIRVAAVLRDLSERRRAEEAALHAARGEAARAEAERLQREVSAVLSSISDPFFAVDPGWRVTYINAAAERLLGRGREELVGRVLWEELPNVFDSRFGREYRHAVETRQTRVFEAHSFFGDRWFLVHAYPSESGLSVYFLDVTDRRRAEAALRESERRWRSVFENSMDAIFLAGPDGRVYWSNAASTAKLGYSADELRKLPRDAFVDPNDPRYETALEERARTGRFRGELSVRRKDGTFFPVEISSALFRDERGAAWTSIFMRDITARKAQEAERERLLAELDEKQRWLEAVLQHVPLSVVLVDPQGRVHLNARAEETMGVHVDSRRGTEQYQSKLFYPDGTAVPREEVLSSRVLRTGETVLGAEFLVEGKGGHRVPVLGSAAPIRDAQGHTIGAVGVFQDVSDRMRVEEESRARERLLGGIFEILPVGVWVADAEGRFIRSNPAAERMWGGARSGITHEGEQVWWAETGRPVPPEERALNLALRKGETILGQHLHIRSFDGVERSILASALPLFDERTRFAGAVVVHEDVTKLQQIEDELRRAVRSRDEVLGIVAHDLRNPLNNILLSLEVLGRGKEVPEDTANAAVEALRRQALRMNRLIGDLLEVARIESGAVSLERECVRVPELLADVVESQAASAASADVVVRTDVPEEPLEVWGDADRLTRVLENLIANAVKFTPPGGTVLVGAAAHEGEVVFSVADTGRGIAAEDLPHVFDRFWQASRSDKRGSGLGLSIVKGLVEAHGGRVWVESEPGVGSTFFVAVPQRAAPRAELGQLG